ncbi:choice-of-anchor I family protein [Staphylococcus caeli]|uniref:choice-of-anchor I family protein n=1 Tax=Staphylococcus caeli TaxID=2201815 RepID=UPI003F5570FA
MFKHIKKNTRYSIRTSAMGAASIVIGTCLFVSAHNDASADEISSTQKQQSTNEIKASNNDINTENAGDQTAETSSIKQQHATQSQNKQSASDNQLEQQDIKVANTPKEEIVSNNKNIQQETDTQTTANKNNNKNISDKNNETNKSNEQKSNDANSTNETSIDPEFSVDKQKEEQPVKSTPEKPAAPEQSNNEKSRLHKQANSNESETTQTDDNVSSNQQKQTTETTNDTNQPSDLVNKHTENESIQAEAATSEQAVASTPNESQNNNNEEIHTNKTSFNKKPNTKKIETLSTKERKQLYNKIQKDAAKQEKVPKATLRSNTSNTNTSNKSRKSSDKPSLNINHTGRYDSGSDFGKGGTEIVKYNPKNGYAYSINGDKEALDILDIKNTKNKKINLVKRIYLQDAGIASGDLTSVAVHPSGKYIALSAPAKDKTQQGHVVFYTADGKYLSNLTVGSLPDMLTFTKDGKHLLVANEGEPSDDYKTNPEGSVSIIDTSGDPAHLNSKNVRTASLTKAHMNDSIRKLGPNKDEAYLNLEPEFIAVDKSGRYAYITIQESSAIAKLDIKKGEFEKVQGLPYKDHSLPENAMDPSDKDGKKELRTVPVLGMLQPDTITTYEHNGETYLLIANEGDSQDYDGYSEEVRVKDIKDDIELDAKYYKGYTQAELDKLVANGLFDDDQLGRLKVTTSHKFRDENGKYKALVSFGGRSFSILKGSDLSLVYDSGKDIEQRIKDILPDRFNANYEDYNEIEVDGRSDDKGPEVESVEVGAVGNQTYAFVGLERTGGIMIYNITDPTHPKFVKYVYDPENKDISPEGVTFIPAEDSPNGKAMLMVSYELSGTTSTYTLDDLSETEQPDSNSSNGDNDGNNDNGNHSENGSNEENNGHHENNPNMPNSEQDSDSETPNNANNNHGQMTDAEFNNWVNQTDDVHGQIEQPIDAEFNNWMNQAHTGSNISQSNTIASTNMTHQNTIQHQVAIISNAASDNVSSSKSNQQSNTASQLPDTGKTPNQAPIWSTLILGACLLIIGRKQKTK